MASRLVERHAQDEAFPGGDGGHLVLDRLEAVDAARYQAVAGAEQHRIAESGNNLDLHRRDAGMPVTANGSAGTGWVKRKKDLRLCSP